MSQVVDVKVRPQGPWGVVVDRNDGQVIVVPLQETLGSPEEILLLQTLLPVGLPQVAPPTEVEDDRREDV